MLLLDVSTVHEPVLYLEVEVVFICFSTFLNRFVCLFRNVETNQKISFLVS
jgi:hypothetical protein